MKVILGIRIYLKIKNLFFYIIFGERDQKDNLFLLQYIFKASLDLTKVSKNLTVVYFNKKT